jgi:phosphoribosylformylglycinamidine synthase
LLEGDIATALLSETPGRVVVAVKRENAHVISTIAQKYDVALTKIGVTGGRSLVINDADIALDDLRSAYTDTIPRLFG